MNILTWIAIASLYKLNPDENKHLKDHCGAKHLDVTEGLGFASTGVAVPPNKYPFTAAIARSRGSRCTGSLISNRHVLTAAHCVYDLSQIINFTANTCNPIGRLLPLPDITIYLGTKCPKPGECPSGEKRTPYKPRYVISHPEFATCFSAANDIAVIELDEDVNSEEASPICMPEEDDMLRYGTVTSIGYGYDARNRPDKAEPGLQEVNLTITQYVRGKFVARGYEKAICQMKRCLLLTSLMFVFISAGFVTLQVFVHFEQQNSPARLRMVRSGRKEVHNLVQYGRTRHFYYNISH